MLLSCSRLVTKVLHRTQEENNCTSYEGTFFNLRRMWDRFLKFRFTLKEFVAFGVSFVEWEMDLVVWF